MPWYMALCEQCDMRQPFRDEHERDQWAEDHRQAIDPWTNEAHTVTTYEERG